MKIQLKTDDHDVFLHDDMLDNDNFVTLRVDMTDKDGNLIIFEEDIPLDEFLSAVQAFQQKRVMRVTREDNYRD